MYQLIHSHSESPLQLFFVSLEKAKEYLCLEQRLTYRLEETYDIHQFYDECNVLAFELRPLQGN